MLCLVEAMQHQPNKMSAKSDSLLTPLTAGVQQNLDPKFESWNKPGLSKNGGLP